MALIERIKTYTILYIIVFALVAYYFDKSFSVLAGGAFMLASFHLLSLCFKGFGESGNAMIFSKFFLRSSLFYGALIILLSNQSFIDATYFLLGSTTLIISILTNTLIFKEGQ